MARIKQSRVRRPVIVGVAALSAVAAATPFAAAAAPKKAEPALRLVTASPSVTLDHYADEPGVFLALGTYMVAGSSPFELRVSRRSYRDPIVATQVVRTGRKVTTRTLPA